MRALAIIGALLLGLIGLAMSLCGGGFFLGALFEHSPGPDPYRISIIETTIPFIIAGVLCIVGCVAILRRVSRKRRQQPPDPPQAG